LVRALPARRSSDLRTALTDARVQTHTGSGRGTVVLHGAGGGEERGRILGVNPELSGMAAGGGELLGQNLAGGDAHLPADEVDTRDLLGDGVFDVDARIVFHEDDRAVLTEEELARGGAYIADMGEQSRRRLGDDALLVGRQER